jgi:hypothetical protein
MSFQEGIPLAEITIHVPDTLLRLLPKSHKGIEEVVRLGLKYFTARHKKASGVVASTFAALPMKKHTRREQVIEQTTYGQ